MTDEMGDSTRNLADKMKEKFGFMKALPMHEDKLLNSKKVSDHHAIIPTVNVSDADFSEIPNGEQKILSLITARLLAALEDAEYECERLEIINSNLERQLKEANRELEKNIEILQGFKNDIEGLVSSFEKVKND